MNYNEFKELITDYISGNLSEEKHRESEQFLIDNPNYQSEVEEMKLLWNNLEEEIPEPSTAMDVNFYTMLNSEKEKQQKSLNKENFFSRIFAGSMTKQLAYTFAILAVGFFTGNFLNKDKTEINTQNEIAYAKAEVEDVRSQLVLTLLEQPSANKRLQAVSEANKLTKVTKTITNALFATLNNDENVNVRLSAIEALANYSNIPEVREGLISSIVLQESPMVQMALADLMVALQEKRAVKSFEKLIEKEDINESAKAKMQQSIQSLI